jgi:hypothetical protein
MMKPGTVRVLQWAMLVVALIVVLNVVSLYLLDIDFRRVLPWASAAESLIARVEEAKRLEFIGRKESPGGSGSYDYAFIMDTVPLEVRLPSGGDAEYAKGIRVRSQENETWVRRGTEDQLTLFWALRRKAKLLELKEEDKGKHFEEYERSAEVLKGMLKQVRATE